MQLNNGSLLQCLAFINNQWNTTSDDKYFEVFNPANGELVANVADCGPLEAQSAIEAASAAFPMWSKKTAYERATIMRRWFNLLHENADDLALLMTTEQGKPLTEARGEVIYGASFIEWFAEEGRRVYGDVIPTPLNDRRILTLKQPVGVVAAITPWNFPIAMITRKISPAIAAGCTIVLKPASLTPLSALAIAQLSVEAGFPPGVINIVPSSAAAEIGKVLTTHPRVMKLSFTGSTETGKTLMQQAASTVKKISLELGGNAPLIVFDDADVQQAVTGAIKSKYRNAGQTCVCTNRIFVQSGIYHSFVSAYSKAVSELNVGEGTRTDVQIGPLINGKALSKVTRLLDDAVSHGARVTTGGHVHTAGEFFFEPTIVEDCTAMMALSREEIFGPVSAIYRFETEADAIAAANDTEYGLAAYFFSKNIDRIWRVAESLDYGIVGINEGIVSHAEAPFGGMKQSGIGREGSKYGIEEYLEIKYVCMGGLV
ncbi:NAD-dependent succinate-semialdehyde dehydrogenase [Segetibacter sp. 3557_3]|uniref:NAD-dependent succinate-semialdehyde dehydrogenase n=1 Tax=Segetibacter sp. 3557_3 TaxID=2547429 RepID=UPI001058B64D|nr:NAD-dependent succinate-semialdehyde dehydrogenase [Segetibacter sp. 3557_3]TDH26191.1 NAD-dependent succinate-semialdehyde dehydrogenase [Segetibacter sp. 3557_3]